MKSTVSTGEAASTNAISFGGAGGNALRTLVRLLVKRQRLAMAIMLATLAAGLVYYSQATQLYRSTATLEISREIEQVVSGDDNRSRQTTVDMEFYETQFGLLRSKAIAAEVVKTLGLDRDPSYIDYKVKAAADNTPAQRTERTRLAIEKLMENTQIVPARLSRLVDIRISDDSPARSARIANALAEAYMRQNLAKRIDRTSFARDFLQRRIGEVRTALEDSERRLVKYAEAAQIITVPQSREENRAAQGTASQSLAGSELAQASEMLGEARAARIKAAAEYDAARASGNARTDVLQNTATGQLEVQRATLASEVAQLSSSYGDEYAPLAAKRAALAKLNQQIAAYQSRFAGASKAELNSAIQREAELSARVEGLKARLIELSNRSIPYTILQREVDTNRILYDGLLQQYKQANAAADLSSNNVTFVLRAEPPQKPYFPKLLTTLLFSLFGGAVLAMMMVMVAEVFDARISTPEDFRERLSAPLLGVIPKTDEPPLQALEDPRSQLSEAYSSTHANLRFISAEGTPHVFGLTSTRPSEGKSTTAVALAAIFARRGDKVLIIDGDLRRPSLHRRLDVSNDIGLSNLLTGDELSDAIIHQAGSFDYIVTGPMPPSPSDLLASGRLSALITQLRSRYTRIVIDAPPVLGLVDAPLIATACDGILFVVEAGGPRLGPIRRSVERIEELNGRIFGFIFTKFDLRSSLFSSYGAYEYYGYNYGDDDARKRGKRKNRYGA